MKKTIIITISMLAICAVLIAVFANSLTSTWQAPQQDEIDLSVSSPVEMVESEFKEFGSYPFIIFDNYIETLQDKRGMEALMAEEIEKDENMISEAEAAYIGGNALEKLFPSETFTDKQFVIILLKCKSPHAAEHTVYEGSYNIENPEDHPVHSSRLILQYTYRVDAYTGEVLYVSQFQAETDINHKRIPEQALEYATELAKAMGYDSYSKYNIEMAQYNVEIGANVWGVELLVAEDKSLSFCFNDLEDNFFYAVNDTTSKYFQLVMEEGTAVQ